VGGEEAFSILVKDLCVFIEMELLRFEQSQSWLGQLGPRVQTFFSGLLIVQSWFLQFGPILQTTLYGPFLSVNESKISCDIRYSLLSRTSFLAEDGRTRLLFLVCILTIKLYLLEGLGCLQCIDVQLSQFARSRLSRLFFIKLDIRASALRSP